MPMLHQPPIRLIQPYNPTVHPYIRHQNPTISMICPECHDLNLQGREEGFIVRVSKFQPGCKFCALLLSLVEHFAPLVTHGDLEPKLRIDQMMQDCAAVNIEIMVNDLAQGLGSVVTAASVWLYRTTGRRLTSLYCVFPKLTDCV